VDLAGEGLDFAIRFGDGSWTGTESMRLFGAPLSPVCSPALGAGLSDPADLGRLPLLRSYRDHEWLRWFASVGQPCPVLRGPMFDSSVLMAEAAAQGAGVALVPCVMFSRDLASGRLVRPFAHEIEMGAYWLTRLKTKAPTKAMRYFAEWLENEAV
jgi:LysR family transcriptional regulator of beta-lactamase